MKAPDESGYLWPTPQQELLLKAAVWKGPRALDAWAAWKSQVDLAQHLDLGSYRLLPKAYVNLREHGVDDPLMSKLKGIHRKTWVENQLRFRRLASILQSFDEAGIPTLVLKCTALAAVYYKDFGVRPMSDFDLLVPPSRAEEAVGLLRAAGWTPIRDIPEPFERTLASHNAVTFKQGDEIGLHWHLFAALFEGNRRDADADFWEEAIPARLFDMTLSVLGHTNQFLHVCVHGHMWNTLPPLHWVADAMTILGAHADLDWDRLVAQARRHGKVLPLAATLAYLRDVFEAPIPARVIEELKGPPTID